MKKRELLERIEALESQVRRLEGRLLEAQGFWWGVVPPVRQPNPDWQHWKIVSAPHITVSDNVARFVSKPGTTTVAPAATGGGFKVVHQ